MHVGARRFRRDLIGLAKGVHDGLFVKFAQFAGLVPDPGGRVVEADEFAEVDGAKTLAHDDLLAADFAQDKSVFAFHIVYCILMFRIRVRL